MVTDNTSQADDTTAFLRAARSGNLEKVVEFLETELDINTANSNGLNALHLASKDGHVEIVTELLKRGAKVDAATKKGNTALHIASLAGQSEIVNILIQYGAAVNIQSQNGFTPLYMAAQENHDQVVKLLLSNGANQSLATEDGFTPLAVAMQQGHDKVVSVLLENDSKGKVRLPALHIAAKKDDCKAADLLLQNDHKPDVTSKSGFTPLHIAAHYGNEEIARLLIKRGADVNYLAKHNISPLHVAAKWGKNNMVKVLLENSAQIDAKTRDGLTPLHCAARSGHEQVVTTLLENSAPISARTKNGLAPLHMASQGDHVDAARVLLYHRAPVDEVTTDYLTSLHVAAHCGHVRVAKLLLDRKADPNARALNGFTPLHIACKKNRIKVVELLLKHGASIESTTESGLTPLHVASFMGCMNIVIFLLQHEANPDVPTVRGETPLHLAARANQTDIIRILLRNGAKVDARAREQQTPLHIASRLGNIDIVMLLLQHGAAVDTTTKDMYTALHIAAKEGQEEVATILVENNASLKATTKNGFTPLHIAAKYGNMNVAKILLQKDSKLDAQGKNDISPLHLACHYDHPNVANLLLEKGASPHLASQNGHTPLHIAARKNQMDIASTLLENGANANAESKAGFTPLHLSAQKGHYDMTNLLIEHGADPNHKAKNGLTALHLCAQEDFIRVASILVKNGGNVESETETGYRPIHIAAHFGNLSMIRFLLKHNADIDVRTNQSYTPLHQAAQQGHAHIVTALLEGNASHKACTNDGLTALNIAQKLGYISVTEVLKGLSYDTLTPDNKNWDEKYKVIAPESLQETSFMSDSDDEGGSDALTSEQPYRYLTADLMKSLRDDSLPIDVTRDDPIHRPVTKEEKQEFTQSNNYCLAENFDSNDGLNLGRLHFRSFLVSFLVDARGGAMKGCRHSGVRIIVPPRRARMPIRVTCRLIKPTKVANPPPLMEGEALATRIIEMGPVGATFLGPVLIDIPHFASVRGNEREIIILKSENGETWKEHDNSVDNDDTLLNTPYDPQMSASHPGRITRIITTEFPQYFAIVTRIKQEVHVIGAEGGILISSVANHVQAVFPSGALTKKIKVGLQAHVIPAELTAKLLGNCVAVSPVITIEPRRRKFHKPITLTIPVPQAANKGMINQYGGETPTLRLLCSIAGGTSESQWEDVTGSTVLTFMNDRVSFTTTVSARFWLMDCRNIIAVPKMATELYEESLFVPYITNFVIYSKRMDILEATLRILCMTDGKEGMHTLERQEEFIEIVKSRDVEALDGKDLYIEFSGNLVPVTKSGVQLKFIFKAFRQNRLSFHVKVKDPLLDPVARMLFMREPKVAKGEPPQQPICVLNIVLPEITTKANIQEKLKDYEDSNIINQKLDSLKCKYKMEQKEKYDEPKDTSPLEKKFITDTLQKEQADAVTIQESLAQKAACPLESVDASYPNKVVGQEHDLSPSVEKQTYSEKRKFWEDISRKRESYQRSESEISRTSQLTINESDSDYLQNVVSEEDTTEIISDVGKSETMEDLNIPDISECSVAEKAHYFEEQIQKEMTKITPKLQQQESVRYDNEALTKMKVGEKEKMEKEEKHVIESMQVEKVEVEIQETVVKAEDQEVEDKKEIKKSASEEEKEKDESKQMDKEIVKVSAKPVTEVCKELLNKEREVVQEMYEETVKPLSKEMEHLEELTENIEEIKVQYEVEIPLSKEELVVDVSKPLETSCSVKTTETLEDIIKERKDISGKVKEFLEDDLTEEAMHLPVDDRLVTTDSKSYDKTLTFVETTEILQTDTVVTKEQSKISQEHIEDIVEHKVEPLLPEKQDESQTSEPLERTERKAVKIVDEVTVVVEGQPELIKGTVEETTEQETDVVKSVQEAQYEITKPCSKAYVETVVVEEEVLMSKKEKEEELEALQTGSMDRRKEKIDQVEDVSKEKSGGRRIITEETTIIYKVQKDGTLVQEQVLKSVQIEGATGVTVTQVPEVSVETKIFERGLPEGMYEIQSSGDIKTETVPLTSDVKREIQQFLDGGKKYEEETSEVHTSIPEEKVPMTAEDTAFKLPEKLPSTEKETSDLFEKTGVISKEVAETRQEKEEESMITASKVFIEAEMKQAKKEFESRIPISTTKVEKVQKEVKSKVPLESKQLSEKSEDTKTSDLDSSDITSPTSKKKEFESRIPKRVIDTKPTEKVGKKDTHGKKESETYTVTEKKSSEEVTSKLEEHSTTKSQTQTFSKTFADPQEGVKIFEDIGSTMKDFSTITSKVDHKTSSTLQKKEVVSSEISTGTDKIITHEEKERVERKKSSESKLKKESPSETLEEKKSKLEETDRTAIQKMSMNLSDGQEVIDASASESRADTKKEEFSKTLEDEKEIMTHETGTSRLRESNADVAIRIKREKSEDTDDTKTVHDMGERVRKAIVDSDKIELIAQGESNREIRESFDVTRFEPSEKTPEDIPSTKDTYPEKTEEQISESESLEKQQEQKFKEIEARTIAETLIQSIESEIERRSSTDLKSELLSKEYLEQIMSECTDTDHEKLADDLTRKFESIMKKSVVEESIKGKTEEGIVEQQKLETSIQEEFVEKGTTRDSMSISEDITKDEESFPHEKEESFPLSSSQVRLQDRDITMSPSSISEQIDFEETMDVDTNELEDISKPTLSPQSEKQRLDKSSSQIELLQRDLHSDVSFTEEKIMSEISGARVLEILEPAADSQSRQDSVDVPSLEMDEYKISEQTSKGIPSLYESVEVDSLEKVIQERDITISPSTVSEDTNIDYSMVQEHSHPVLMQKEHDAGARRADSFEIESPPMVSPRSKTHGLEIKPVNWMIGDEKIEISETLQPSQVFNQELEAYESSIRQQSTLSSQDGSVDLEQESGTKSSEEISVVESIKETTAEDTGATTSVTMGGKFTVISVSEQDFENELVENKLDISCQKLVDTLQQEYDAKAFTGEYTVTSQEEVLTAEQELEKQDIPEITEQDDEHSKIEGMEISDKSIDLKMESEEISDKSIDLKMESEEISDRSTDLKMEGEEMSDKSADLKMESDQVSGKSTDLKMEGEDMSDRSTDLKIQEKEISDKSTDLKVQEKEISDKSIDSKVQEKEISDKSTDLEEQEKEISDRNTDFKVQEKELSDKSTDLKVQERETSDKSSDLKVQEKEISDTSTDLKGQEKEISDKSTDSKVQEKEIFDKSTDLRMKGEDISDKSTDIIIAQDKDLEVQKAVEPKSSTISIPAVESVEISDKSTAEKEQKDVIEDVSKVEIELPLQKIIKPSTEEGEATKEVTKEVRVSNIPRVVLVDDILKEWTGPRLLKMKPPTEEERRLMVRADKHAKPGRSTTVPSETCAFRIKKDLPSVALSARYAITVLDQVVKKEIAEVKESLEAAKQDLIEELSENSETVIQIKDSPSEFQFKLQPESIPNDLPFLYKPPSLETVHVDHDKGVAKSESPDAKESKHQTLEQEPKDSSESRIDVEESTCVSSEESTKVTAEETYAIETEKSEIETIIAVHEETKDDEEERPSPVPASRSGSDVDNKDESSSLAPPYPVPRRRHKPARVSKRVTSESEADVGSSSGDSSNYQSCDYEIGSGSRPSSSDVEALQSCGMPSATTSEYETAMMSIEHSSPSRPTSQEYHTAATTMSSRESMKSLNSLSSGHLGSIDSTSELSETLVPSETDIDKEELEENIECAFEPENTEHSDSSGSDIPIDETMDKIDSHIPSRMKRSSEMIFPQIIDDSAASETESTNELVAEESKTADSATSAFAMSSGTLQSVDIMTSRVSEDGIQSVCTQVSSTQVVPMDSEIHTPKSEPFDLETTETDGDKDTTMDIQAIESDVLEPEKEVSSASGIISESPEMTMQSSILSMMQQASISTSSTSGISFDTVIEKEKSDRHSPDSDSFELVDKPDIIDDFVVIEEVGREAEEYDSEGKSIRISAIPQISSKNYDRDLENLITETKDESQVSTSQASRNNELFEFESEESPPQVSNEDQYSQSYSDEDPYDGRKKWIEMQFQADTRVYDIEYDRGPLEDIKEEEITDFEAGSSRFGSLGSHKESIGSVGSMRGSFGSTPDYDVLAGKKYFTKPSDHDNISLSSLQEFEHLESTVAAENSKKAQCGSQDSINNGSLPRRYMTSRSGHGDDISLSSLKDFEGLERACREAHLIELRAREEEDLLEHESPENKYKLENLPRTRVDTSTVGSFNPSTSGSDDYEKRIKEIDEIIRIAQSNVEKFDRQDDTTEDISQIEITDTEKLGTQISTQPVLEQEEPDDVQPQKGSNIMETSTDSLELEDNADKKHHPLCRSSDSLEMKTTLDFPSLSSDSLNNVRDQREMQLDMAEQVSNVRRISSDSLDMPLLEQQDVETHEKDSESSNNHSEREPSDNSLHRTSSTETNIRNGKTKTMPHSDT